MSETQRFAVIRGKGSDDCTEPEAEKASRRPLLAIRSVDVNQGELLRLMVGYLVTGSQDGANSHRASTRHNLAGEVRCLPYSSTLWPLRLVTLSFF